jgi:hypothetical protein
VSSQDSSVQLRYLLIRHFSEKSLKLTPFTKGRRSKGSFCVYVDVKGGSARMQGVQEAALKKVKRINAWSVVATQLFWELGTMTPTKR